MFPDNMRDNRFQGAWHIKRNTDKTRKIDIHGNQRNVQCIHCLKLLIYAIFIVEIFTIQNDGTKIVMIKNLKEIQSPRVIGILPKAPRPDGCNRISASCRTSRKLTQFA